MSIEDWNIEGIAEGVIEEMRRDSADINDIVDYICEVSWTVYSREPDDAELVAAMVKKVVQEKYEKMEGIGSEN